MAQLLSHQEQLLGAAAGRFALLEAHRSPASQPAPGAPARRGGICRLFGSPTSWLCLAPDTLPRYISCCYLMSWPSPWKQTDLIPHLSSHACILGGPWLGKGRALVWGALSALLPGGEAPAAKAPSTLRPLGASPTVTDTCPCPIPISLLGVGQLGTARCTKRRPQPAMRGAPSPRQQPAPRSPTRPPGPRSEQPTRAGSALPRARSRSPNPGFGGWS